MQSRAAQEDAPQTGAGREHGGALDGITVIELAQSVSGPYCAKLFADYGADVIKVVIAAQVNLAARSAIGRRRSVRLS
jgi:crotonobetainyl-CoA:carnitine CoA-transferase CaiB-like acyl-CoA transferase